MLLPCCIQLTGVMWHLALTIHSGPMLSRACTSTNAPTQSWAEDVVPEIHVDLSLLLIVAAGVGPEAVLSLSVSLSGDYLKEVLFESLGFLYEV